MKQEDIRKLWEWCGFRHFIETKHGRGWDTWEYPRKTCLTILGLVKGSYSYLPELTLDNLFKYAVPTVKEKLSEREFALFILHWAFEVALHPEKAADLLAQDILKVIENE